MTGEAKAVAASSFYAYHQETKHTLARLMNSHHYLDWANQPNPFRTYAGADRIELPRNFLDSKLDFFAVLEATLAYQETDLSAIKVQDADLSFISNLLFYSMSLSAWKQLVDTDHRWSLRVNPSSGNLHPTETHLLIRNLHGLQAGVYHYSVADHFLEQRHAGDRLSQIWELLGQESEPPDLLICLSSIFWREAWKYRQRAFRYCHHDAGHALAAIMLSAGILGFQTDAIGEFPDEGLKQLLGLSGSDENPLLLIALSPAVRQQSSTAADQQASAQPVQLEFFGRPNTLSGEVLSYPEIEAVYAHTSLTGKDWEVRKNRTPGVCRHRPSDIVACGPEVSLIYGRPDSGTPAHQLVRSRRSAVDLDGHQRMPLKDLGLILASATRGFRSDFQAPAPWSAADRTAGYHLIHLYAYVHRVDGLEPGIYYWDRLAQSLVPLVLADERAAAKYVSCFQDIAADGCFALSMIGDLNRAYADFGDRGYRYLHYEAGCIGQWIYLSALARGYESTGIGCFLDDDVNRILGLEAGYECIYNFTVGRAVHDPRLTTRRAYEFLPDGLV